MRRLIFPVLLLIFTPALTLAQPAVQLEQAWEVTGLARPESAVYDAVLDAVYVSSINGDGSAKDGNGFITMLSPDGKLVAREWVSGLNAPKGLALVGSKLYAADVDELVEIDTRTGKVTARYPGEGAAFLNDVAADEQGVVYVTDSRSNLVFRLADGKLTRWLEHAGIKAPNGIYVGPAGIVVVAGDGSTENPGRDRYMQTVSLDGKEIKPLRDRKPLGAVDAVEPDGKGGYFLSDWGAGQVMHYTVEAGPVMLVQLGQGTADLDYVAGRELLFLPVMMSDRIIAYRVKWGR